jgi:chromosome segregation ATPase
MLQIANETLQAQCKVSAVRVKPSATTSRAGYPTTGFEVPSRSHRPAHTVADLSPITERTQAAVEREEEIKEAMNDALGASTRRITDLEGELEHAKAIAAVADKSPSSQGAPDGTDAAELEKLRKKLKVSAGLVKKLRDNETGLKDELATAQKRIAEGVKDRDAEDRAVATQKNLLRKTEADLVALRAELKAKDAELSAREEANAETAKTQAAKAEALHERVEALEAEAAEARAALERKEAESGAMTAAAFDSANAQANKSEELQHELEATRAEMAAANEQAERLRADANAKIERAEAAYREMEKELAAAKKDTKKTDPSLPASIQANIKELQAQLDKKKVQLEVANKLIKTMKENEKALEAKLSESPPGDADVEKIRADANQKIERAEAAFKEKEAELERVRADANDKIEKAEAAYKEKDAELKAAQTAGGAGKGKGKGKKGGKNGDDDVEKIRADANAKIQKAETAYTQKEEEIARLRADANAKIEKAQAAYKEKEDEIATLRSAANEKIENAEKAAKRGVDDAARALEASTALTDEKDRLTREVDRLNQMLSSSDGGKAGDVSSQPGPAGAVAALERTLAEAESSFAREREALAGDVAAARSEAKDEKVSRESAEADAKSAKSDAETQRAAALAAMTEVDKVKATAAEIDAQLQETVRDADGLREECARAKTAAKDAKRKLDEMTKERATTERSSAESAARVTELESAVASLEGELVKTAEDLRETGLRLERAEAVADVAGDKDQVLSEARTAKRDAEEAADAALVSARAAKAEAEAARADAETEAKTAASLRAQLTEIQTKMSALEQRLETTKARADSAEKANKSLSSVETALAAARTEHAAEKSQMRSAWDEERDALKRELDALWEANSEDAARETARDSGVARRISELEHTAEEAAVAAAEEKRVYAERYAALSADFEASAERNLVLETECKKLQDDLRESERKTLASKEVNDRLTELAASAEAESSVEIAKLRADLAVAVADKETMFAQTLELEAATQDASTALADVKAEQDSAAAKVEAAERRRDAAKGEVASLEKELAGKRAKIDSLEAEVGDLRGKEADAVETCGSLRATIARLEAGSTARARTDDENKLKAEMYAVQEVETLKVRLREADAMQERLQKQVTRAEADKTDAETERESLREGINKTTRENRALSARVAHLEAQDASHEREKNEALREAAAARAEAEATSSAALSASSARAAAELRAEELRDQLRGARGDVTSAAAAALEMERHMGSAQRAASESAMKLKTHSAGKELVTLRLREKTQELSDLAETLREERSRRREQVEQIAGEKETILAKLNSSERSTQERTEELETARAELGVATDEVARMASECALAEERAAKAAARAQRLHARLFPDGAPSGTLSDESDDDERAPVRTGGSRRKGASKARLAIVRGTLLGHPSFPDGVDVTAAMRQRCNSEDGERLCVRVSENLREVFGNRYPADDDVQTKTHVPGKSEGRLVVEYRSTYFGEGGNALRCTVRVGGVTSRTPFLTESMWIEAKPAAADHAARTSAARIRDAESAVAASRSRAIALEGKVRALTDELVLAKAFASGLERRERELDGALAKMRAKWAAAAESSDRNESDADRHRKAAFAAAAVAHRAVEDARTEAEIAVMEAVRLERLSADQRAREIRLSQSGKGRGVGSASASVKGSWGEPGVDRTPFVPSREKTSVPAKSPVDFGYKSRSKVRSAMRAEAEAWERARAVSGVGESAATRARASWARGRDVPEPFMTPRASLSAPKTAQRASASITRRDFRLIGAESPSEEARRRADARVAALRASRQSASRDAGPNSPTNRKPKDSFQNSSSRVTRAITPRRGAGDVTTPGAGVLRSKLEAAEARLASAVADREARLAEAEALRRRAWASSVTGSRGRDEIEALARTVIAKSEKVLREDD